MPAKPLPDLLCLDYQTRVPEFASAPRRTNSVATVCGSVRIGAAAHLGAGSVIRGDGHEVRIGDDFFLGERSTLHALAGQAEARIGAGVSLGRNCALLACAIGDRVVLEDNVVVLEGAQIEAGCAVERNSLVPGEARLASGQLYRGNPVVAVRALEPGELQSLRGRVRNAPPRAEPLLEPSATPRPRPGAAGFVALTAQVAGRLELASDASIWFGARVDGGHHGIHLGSGSSLQDNTTAYAMASPLQIGEGVTVGRNASLQDCRIGDRSLLGVSCFIAAGTVIEPDVLVMPGSLTLPRQVLQGGWVWGGRPVRSLMPMTDRERERVAEAARRVRDATPLFRRAIENFSLFG